MISNFVGPTWFLSCHFPVPIFLDSSQYPTVTHAWVAAHTNNLRDRELVRGTTTANVIKVVGKLLRRPDWTASLSEEILLQLLYQKFSYEKLRRELLLTGANKIERSDKEFWGMDIGKLLMKVREEIRDEQTRGQSGA